MSRYKIMLADDEGIVIDSLKFIIEKEFGELCSIEFAKTGRSVIELAENFRPDIAIMDIQMPGINGIEAMREIRETNRNVIFIVMSAYDKFDYAKEAIKLGVLEYITKPMEKTRIIAALGKAMDQIDRERNKRSNDLLIREKLETVMPIIESGLLYNLLFQEHFTEDIENYKQLLGINQNYAYVLAVVCGETQEGNHMTNAVGSSVKMQQYGDLLREYLKEAYPGMILGMSMANKLPGLVPCEETQISYEDRISMIEKSRELVRELKKRTQISFRLGAAILRAIGDSKRPLYYLVVCCIVNIVLDLLLVLYFGLGVLGVAVATLVSQAISAALVTWALMYKVDSMVLSVRKIRIHREVLKNMLQIGFPSGLQASMYSISNMIVQAALNLLGVDTMAAWTAYGKIDSIFWMINSSFGIALTTFVGQNFGAGKWDRVRKGTRVCLGMAVGTAVCLTALLMMTGRYLLGIFTGDAAVVEIGMTMMYSIAPAFVMFVFIEIFSGSLRAQGYTFVTTVISVLGICVFRIIWVGLITPGKGLRWIVACYPISWIMCAVFVSGYYLYKQNKIIARMELQG